MKIQKFPKLLNYPGRAVSSTSSLGNPATIDVNDAGVKLHRESTHYRFYDDALFKSTFYLLTYSVYLGFETYMHAYTGWTEAQSTSYTGLRAVTKCHAAS